VGIRRIAVFSVLISLSGACQPLAWQSRRRQKVPSSRFIAPAMTTAKWLATTVRVPSSAFWESDGFTLSGRNGPTTQPDKLTVPSEETVCEETFAFLAPAAYVTTNRKSKIRKLTLRRRA